MQKDCTELNLFCNKNSCDMEKIARICWNTHDWE